jgi:acid phosphatase class B
MASFNARSICASSSGGIILPVCLRHASASWSSMSSIARSVRGAEPMTRAAQIDDVKANPQFAEGIDIAKIAVGNHRQALSE